MREIIRQSNENEIESHEQLQKVISTLRDTAEKYRRLENEADVALSERDTNKRNQKLEEGRQLFIDLHDRLPDALKNVNRDTQKKILSTTNHLFSAARKYENTPEAFGYIIEPKDVHGGKNLLEQLILSLE